VKAGVFQSRSSADRGTRRNRYYCCSNHDPIKAGGPEKRCTERRIRVYQAGHIDMKEVNRRATEVDSRRRELASQQAELTAQRHQLAVGNRLRQRVSAFAKQAADGIDALDFDDRQRLLRLIVEQVRVQGWQVELRLRIPLDTRPEDDPPKDRDRGERNRRRRVSRQRPFAFAWWQSSAPSSSPSAARSTPSDSPRSATPCA
jgi:hypothetical protein